MSKDKKIEETTAAAHPSAALFGGYVMKDDSDVLSLQYNSSAAAMHVQCRNVVVTKDDEGKEVKTYPTDSHPEAIMQLRDMILIDPTFEDDWIKLMHRLDTITRAYVDKKVSNPKAVAAEALEVDRKKLELEALRARTQQEVADAAASAAAALEAAQTAEAMRLATEAETARLELEASQKQAEAKKALKEAEEAAEKARADLETVQREHSSLVTKMARLQHANAAAREADAEATESTLPPPVADEASES